MLDAQQVQRDRACQQLMAQTSTCSGPSAGLQLPGHDWRAFWTHISFGWTCNLAWHILVESTKYTRVCLIRIVSQSLSVHTTR
jgi:hypothetical protein